ncbi:MAG: RhuM family protein [Enterobacterales bacterium]|nr:RhuM family protein [Enterobacterales bacterium]
MAPRKEKPKSGKTEMPIIRSSAAEYLTFVAAGGQSETSVEMRYEDENIWLTQKMMATLYDVSVPAINQHLKRIFADNELTREATVKKYLIVQAEGSREVQAMRHIPMTMQDWEERLGGFLKLWDREILQDAGKVTAEIARTHAETEFEKYRIVQDRLFESDFDRLLGLQNKDKKK